MKIKLHNGPWDGKQLQLADHRMIPWNLFLPIWPDPDPEGPPYPVAVYWRRPMSDELDFWYESTIDQDGRTGMVVQTTE